MTTEEATTGIGSVADDKGFFVVNEGTDIVVRGIASDGMLRLYNTQGACVLTQEVTAGETRIDGHRLTAGIYIITVTDCHGDVRTARFVM